MGTPNKKGKFKQAVSYVNVRHKPLSVPPGFPDEGFNVLHMQDLSVLFKKARENIAKNTTPPKVLTSYQDRGDKLTDHHGQFLKFPAHQHNEQVKRRQAQVKLPLNWKF
jgi:hypothetical protein